MIYAELAGGLGNQMFIYAFARALGLVRVAYAWFNVAREKYPEYLSYF